MRAAMRTIVLTLALAAVVSAAPGAMGEATACVRAREAKRLLGWSEDGAYALLAHVADDGRFEHAEILPTAYAGSVLVVMPHDDVVAVTRVKVGACADFGDEDG